MQLIALSKNGKHTKNLMNKKAMNTPTLKTIILYVTCLFLLSMESCCTKTIVEPDVVEIVIDNKETGRSHSVTDKDSIQMIVKTINTSKREFCIFIAHKEMTLKYKSKKDRKILINNEGHYLKIDGIPYVNSFGL